jgi:hypothetical protein
MELGRFVRTWSMPLAVAVATGCSSGGGDVGPGTGTLSLQLTDASVDEVAEIWVQFTGVRLKPQSGEVIEIPFTAPLRVDMLTLTDGNTESLLNGETVPAGTYNWIELQVEAEFDSVYDSYVMTDIGGQEEIHVPSGSQTGLRLVSPFTITANQETSFLIDWDMRLGLVNAPGQTSGYLLRPAFRIIDLTEYGTLSGTVADSLVNDASCTNDPSADTGNAVYIYDEFDSSVQDPDDIGGAAGPTPVATATVKQADNGLYTYQVILSPGAYTVAFTCQAGDDLVDSDQDIAFALPVDPDVTIAHGDEIVLDF